MNKLELTENDRQDINILIGLGQSILENENKLAELEAKFEKQSAEYKSTLESLKSTLALEENIYIRMDFCPEKIIAIFLELGNPHNFQEQLTILISENSNDLVKTRIINQLYEKLINHTQKKNIGGLSINPRNGKTEFFNPENMLKLETAIKNDVLNTILTLLAKEIDNCQNSEVRKALVKKKYNLTFINPEFEKTLINQEFELGELYLTSQAYATIYKLSTDLYENFQYQFTKSLFDIGANKLANMNNNDMINVGEYTKAIILKVLLKTCLLLDNNNNSNNTNFEYILKEQINIQTKFMHKPQTAGLKIILEMLEHIDEDKKVPKVVTLNLTKRES